VQGPSPSVRRPRAMSKRHASSLGVEDGSPGYKQVPLLDGDEVDTDGMDDVSDVVCEALRSASAFDTDDEHVPAVVQFSAAFYFADKREGSLRVDIIRLGGLSQTCSVNFSTEDGSAKAGVTYKATSGRVVFQAGERLKSFNVPLIVNHIWAATLEFHVALSGPEDCSLGQYLGSCRVKVIDDNMFPSNKYCKQLKRGDVGSIAGALLFWEYFKLNFEAGGVAWRTVLALVLDQMQNLYHLALINCEAYLVNVVCKVSDDSEDQLILPSRLGTAYILAAVYIIPSALLHIWTLASHKMDIDGRSRLFLRTSLFRKYLNFSEASREAISAEDLQFAIIEEAGSAVSGYMAVLSLLQTLGKVLVSLYFVITKNPGAIWVVFAMPTTMFCWAFYRNYCSEIITSRAQVVDLSRHTKECCDNYELLTEYNLRPHANHTFMEKAEVLKEQVAKASFKKLNTEFVLEWTCPVFIGMYLVSAIHMVLSEKLRLGFFLATIHVISSMGGACMTVYSRAMGVVGTFKPLRNLTSFLNSETDLLFWKRRNRWRRKHTISLLNEPNAGKQSLDFDAIPLVCRGVGYQLPKVGEILRDVNLEIPQGRLVALMGPHGSGKSTFLRILGQRLMPSTGQIFVPSHLRVLHVRREAQILHRPLLENLTFGSPPDKAPDLPRMRAILRDLRLDKVLPVLEQEAAGMQNPDWMSSLTFSEQNLLGLARAFIMNPEVMILQNPCIHYLKDLSEHIEHLLVRQVQCRGLHLPEASESHRRPRTVVYTSTRDEEDPTADLFLSTKLSACQPLGKIAGVVQPWTIAEITWEPKPL